VKLICTHKEIGTRQVGHAALT